MATLSADKNKTQPAVPSSLPRLCNNTSLLLEVWCHTGVLRGMSGRQGFVGKAVSASHSEVGQRGAEEESRQIACEEKGSRQVAQGMKGNGQSAFTKKTKDGPMGGSAAGTMCPLGKHTVGCIAYKEADRCAGAGCTHSSAARRHWPAHRFMLPKCSQFCLLSCDDSSNVK